MLDRAKKNRKNLVVGTVLFILIILIKIASYYPAWIEKVYSTGWYPYVAKIYRYVFGWFPMSIGDLLYLAAIVYLSVKVYRLAVILRHRRWDLLKVKTGYTRPLYILASTYILFNLSWGLNYNRLGVAHQLQLKPVEHRIQDLKAVTALLLEKLNTCRQQIGRGRFKYSSYESIFERSQEAYATTSAVYPFLQYEPRSVKRSIYGRAGIYLGFLGYYNPFTGESQLNLTQPGFLLPFVTCHEIAHQLGYASESEANFVGFLVAKNSTDPLFQYSAYFDVFNYANNELRKIDSTVARQNVLQLTPDVRADMQEVKNYFKKSDNYLEPIIKTFYDQYLKANQQVEGVQSYDEVVGWLVAYYKKTGNI